MRFNFGLIFILPVILFGLNTQVRCQERTRIDSLFSVVESLSMKEGFLRDTTLISIYLELGKEFSGDNTNLDSALYYFDNAIGLSSESIKKWKAKLTEEKKLYLKIIKAEGYSEKGKLFYNAKMFRESDSLGLLAIDILKPASSQNIKGVQKRAYKTYTITLLWVGTSLAIRGQYEKALEYFKEADKITKITGDIYNRSKALSTIAVIYKNQGEYKKALDYNFEALLMAKESKDPDQIALVYSNIGILYKNLEDYDKAIDYYKKSLTLYEQTNNKKHIGRMFNNMGVALKNQKKYDEALIYYEDAIKIAKELNREGDLIGAYTNAANILYTQKKYDEAKEYLLEAAEIGEKNDSKTSLVNVYSSLGLTYLKLGQKKKSLSLFQKMMQYAEEMKSDKFKAEAHENLYEYYSQVNDYKEALYHYKEFIKLKDELNDSETQKAAIEKETEYKYQMKKIADSVAFAEQNRMNEQLVKEKEKQLKATKNQQIMLGVVAVLILVFAFFMYNRFKVTQKQHNIIDKQKQIVEHKNKEISDSIDYAKRIQDAILPSRHSLTENLKNGFVLFKPKDVVSGDFYWSESFGDKTYLAVADCTGHGVPGAMLSVICSNALSMVLLEEKVKEPGKILDHTREIIIQKLKKSGEFVNDGMDISLCAIDKHTHEIKWAGANNGIWIIQNTFSGKELKEIKPDKQPIGIYDRAQDFTTHSLTLNPGDSIYLFSDGFADQFGGKSGKKYKSRALKKFLLSVFHYSMDEQKELLEKEFESWKGDHDQVDDVCILGVKL
ncbi:MAG: tetratricopeptide repeat protein [Brumimicrobium sp.]|nr:tetratricopeptide repeat protein [Brumimicrobium sp.]